VNSLHGLVHVVRIFGSEWEFVEAQ
jgi:hypothetical protein